MKKNKTVKKISMPIKEVMDMKILKETFVKYVKLDVEMSPVLQQFLIRYAEKNMEKEVKENQLIEWAFVDILAKRIKEIQTKPGSINGKRVREHQRYKFEFEHPVVQRILNKIKDKVKI
jgi:hypothetical protein